MANRNAVDRRVFRTPRARTVPFATIPHVTGASNYAILLRHMLIHEEGEELHLLKAVPDWWLAEGQEIRLERMPTHFGVMHLTVRGLAQGVRVELTAPVGNPPRRILLHLPESRPLDMPVEGITVVVRKNQKQRWDFPTVVERYRASLTPEERKHWQAAGLE